MIFGWGKREEEEEEEEIEQVLFQGALNGKKPDVTSNRRLVDAGLGLAKDVVSEGMHNRADTIRVEPKGQRASVVFLVDGTPLQGPRLSRPEGVAIVQTMKLFSGLDIKDKSPQRGGLKAEFEENPYELIVLTNPVEGGERLTIRVNDPKIKLETPADLGMTDEFRGWFRELCDKPGLVFFVGPPGSGTSTSMFAMLRGLDSFTKQIFTLGDTEGRKLPNITAYEWKEGDDLEMTLNRVWRVDADIVCVDPVTDAEMAKLLFGFRENGCLISQFPAKDAVSGVGQLLKWVEDPELVAAGLSAVISQKLVRVLCTKCRQAYRPSAAFLQKAGLPPKTSVLYRKPKATAEAELEPCGHCDDTGYRGRIAMFEYIAMSDEMRALIAKNPQPSEIRAQARKEQQLTFQQDGLRLVAEGKTSLEELQRVFKTPG